MKTIHVAVNSRGLTLSQFAVYGQSIATALNNNSNFTNLYPKLDTLQGAIDALNAALVKAESGGKLAISAMHSAEAELNRMLKLLAAHVEYESKNDETIARSSGFGLRKPAIHAAHGFEVIQGLHSGTVDLKCPHGNYASNFWQYAPEPLDVTAWKTYAITTQSSFTIKDLEPGKKYWFRVGQVTPAGQQPFCDPIMLFVI